MERELSSALHLAAARIFEDLCFMTEEEGSQEDRDSARRSVMVRFSGDMDGALVVAVTDEVLHSVVENMLGDDDLSDETARDGLGELANVICGNLLPMIAGEQAIISLQAPEASLAMADPVAARSQLFFGRGDAKVELFLRQRR